MGISAGPETGIDFNRRFVGLIVLAVSLLLFMALSIRFHFSPGYFGAPVILGVVLYFLYETSHKVRYPKPDSTATGDSMIARDCEMFDDLPVPMIDVDTKGAIVRANLAVEKLLSRPLKPGTALSEIFEGLGRSIRDRMSDTLKGHSIGKPEMARCYRDGEEVFVQISMSRMERGGKISVLVILSDATELKTLENQFVQSQKMQAVGQLAGGVAHDFNNILTAITGHADLLLQRHDSKHVDYEDLVQIKQNSNRAAALVRQLLAFSRKQTLLPKSLKLDDTLSELSHLLNRLLGEKVELKTEHGVDLKPVRVDERQFEQVVMNLVVNARDAMPEGGTVLIRTRNLHLNEELNRDRATVHPGDYVVIEVHDTGNGIPPDKRAMIFEPFYTTKKVGEGTGLGLSTVYGIIKQTGGFVFVDSEIGKGTCFSIYLPVNEDAEEEQIPVSAKPTNGDLTGQGRILLVEDEAPVRSFAARALTLRGYTVTEAETGEQALSILEETHDTFDLFVSDVIMPGCNGPTWVRQALKTVPDTKVIFVSGYAEDAFADEQPDIKGAVFLPKPFSLTDLTQKVKEQLSA